MLWLLLLPVIYLPVRKHLSAYFGEYAEVKLYRSKIACFFFVPAYWCIIDVIHSGSVPSPVTNDKKMSVMLIITPIFISLQNVTTCLWVQTVPKGRVPLNMCTHNKIGEFGPFFLILVSLRWKSRRLQESYCRIMSCFVENMGK